MFPSRREPRPHPPWIGALGWRAFADAPTLATRAATTVLAVVAYVLLEGVSSIHEYRGLPITPWNPGLGVVLALMIRSGPQAWLVLFAGVLAAEVFVVDTQVAWPTIVAIAAIIASGYALVVAVARRRFGLDIALTHLRDVTGLLAAGLAGAALVATALILLMLAIDQIDLAHVAQAAVPLVVGDAIGIAVVTPLLLRLAQRRPSLTWRAVARLLPEALAFAVVVAAALGLIVAAPADHGFKFFYLLFLPVVVVAVRHGLDGACLALMATQLGLVGLMHRYGYDTAAFTEFQTLMLVLTATGLIVGVVVSERRVADRAAERAGAQLKQREAEAARAARFHLVGGMASALAHEINQPMTAARALARSAQQLIRTPGADLARADGNLGNLIAQIDHAGQIVRRMRDFLRRGEPHPSTLMVAQTLDGALALVRSDAAAHRVTLTLDAAPDLPALHGDSVQLQQVILNLVRNAIDSIAAAGQADGRVAVRAGLGEDGDSIDIAVVDNGPGIAEDTAARLFEPLITTKPDGLGLGLSIATAIVEAHGGRLRLVASRPGATEFRVTLPLDRPGRTHE